MTAHLFYCVCTVLNTPLEADSPAPVSRGFFTSIVRQWPGSEQCNKSFRAKAASRLRAVFKYLAAPLNRGEFEHISKEAIMANQSARLHVVDQLPINEATDRLSNASAALDSLTFLLAGYDNAAVFDLNKLSNLLEPIRAEVAAALDELRSVKAI